jgi:hypothetical protein
VRRSALPAPDESGRENDASVERPARATAFRSTWIVSSLDALRESGHWDRYVASLSVHRELILSTVAGVWLPMEVACAHYRACDGLGLSTSEVVAMVGGKGDVRRAWYAAYIALATRAASPWEVLLLLDRMWSRSVNGGGVSIVRLRDEQARIDYAGCELFDFAYFREAVRTVLLALLTHVCERPVMRLLPQSEAATGHFIASWA